MRDGESAGPLSGCAYRTVADANAGMLITRGERSDWFVPSHLNRYATEGVGERAYTDYSDGLGYEATGVSSRGVTSIQLSRNGNASTAVALLRITINR